MIKVMVLDYTKEFKCGETTISRADFECMTIPMKTLSLSDEDMECLAISIETEMIPWREWRDNGVISEDKYLDHFDEVMEEYGVKFGMTYYNDEV